VKMVVPTSGSLLCREGLPGFNDGNPLE